MNIKFNYKLSFNTIKRKEFAKNKKIFHKKLFLCKNRLKMIKNYFKKNNCIIIY